MEALAMRQGSMRIGFLVDGRSEYEALPEFLHRCRTPHELITRVLLANVHPEGPPAQIAYQLMKKMPVLASRQVDRVVVLLDHEKQPQCAGTWASEIELQINQRLRQTSLTFEATVVIKYRSLENWLVADVDVLSTMFGLSNRDRNQIAPNKADQVNAVQVLNRCLRGADRYEKVRHSKHILSQASPEQMASNSRSFRRFLRVIEHPLYTRQSRHPV